MVESGTGKDVTHALLHSSQAEDPFRVNERAFGVAPLRLDPVEPWALAGSGAWDEISPHPSPLHLLVVGAHPRALPGWYSSGVVPEQHHRRDARRRGGPRCLVGAPVQELSRDSTHWSAVDEAQPDLVPRRQPEAIAGQGFRIRIAVGHRDLASSHRRPIVGPGRHPQTGHPAPSGLSLEADQPVGLHLGQGDQSVGRLFFGEQVIPLRSRFATSIGLKSLLLVLATMGILKATNDPLISNKWLFFTESEKLALDWTDNHLEVRDVWIGFDERLRTMQDIYGPENSTQDNRYVSGRAQQSAPYLTMSDIIQRRSLRLGLPVPDIRHVDHLYDNGGAQIYHRVPETPYQP